MGRIARSQGPTESDILLYYHHEIARRQALQERGKAVRAALMSIAKTLRQVSLHRDAVAMLHSEGLPLIPSRLNVLIKEATRRPPARAPSETGERDEVRDERPAICPAAAALLGDKVPVQTRRTLQYLMPGRQVEAARQMAVFDAYTYRLALTFLVTDPDSLSRTHRGRRRRLLAATRAETARLHGGDFESSLDLAEHAYARDCRDLLLAMSYLRRLLGSSSAKAFLADRLPGCLTKLEKASLRAESILGRKPSGPRGKPPRLWRWTPR